MSHMLMKKEPMNSKRTSRNTTNIPDKMKCQFETYSGVSFDGVQVHYNSDKPRQMQALAYTQADHIYVAPGQERYLGHELGHIVQQRRGRVHPTGRVNGQVVNDSPALEHEADRMAAGAFATLVNDTSDTTPESQGHSPDGVIQRQIVIGGSTISEYDMVLQEFLNDDNAKLFLMSKLHEWNGSQDGGAAAFNEVIEASAGEFEDVLKLLFEEVRHDDFMRAQDIGNTKWLYCDDIIHLVRCYNDLSSFYMHLANCWLDQTQEDDADTVPEKDEVLSDNESFLQGGYGRFPTIYSYGFLKSGGTVSSVHQGPHTLAHVSVNYLMDHPVKAAEGNLMQLYDNQVISLEEMHVILKDLGIEIKENGRAQAYVEAYAKKYMEWQAYKSNPMHIFQKPNALVRELMEMHPMAVYGWLTNIRRYTTDPAKKASLKSQMGKGERYGNEIKFDKNWRPVQVNPAYEYHMRQYLMRRLGMTIVGERLEQAVNSLMETGSYTITDADRGL